MVVITTWLAAHLNVDPLLCTQFLFLNRSLPNEFNLP